MAEYEDFRTPGRERSGNTVDDDAHDAELSAKSLQEIAHDRGRICKKRGCVVCAPLVERRREKKKERKAAARALLHEKGQPCGAQSCSVTVCVAAREAGPSHSPASSTSSSSTSSSSTASLRDERPVPPPTAAPASITTAAPESTAGAELTESPSTADRRTGGPTPDRTHRRQADRHRVGLPCGFEDCPRQECIDGFAGERTRRHRSHRPCRSSRCDNPICVAARSTT